jgi:Immunity protein 53
MNALQELQQWYQSQCNGDWEHTYGVKIDTLDNPGWSVTIELADTYLYGRTFSILCCGQIRPIGFIVLCVTGSLWDLAGHSCLRRF